MWEAQCGLQSVWVFKSGRSLRSRLSWWSPKIWSIVMEQKMKKEYTHYLITKMISWGVINIDKTLAGCYITQGTLPGALWWPRGVRCRAKAGKEVPEGGDLCILRADSLAEWQKPTQCHKAIIFQFLKNVKKKRKKSKKDRVTDSHWWPKQNKTPPKTKTIWDQPCLMLTLEPLSKIQAPSRSDNPQSRVWQQQVISI